VNDLNLDVEGLLERSIVEYRGVLGVALTPEGQLDLERIATWSSSRRSVLRSALRRAGLEELAGDVPSAGRVRRKDLRVPSEAQVARLRAEGWQALPRGKRAAVFLGLQVGLRASEITGLRRGDVEAAVETGVLRVVRKGGYEAQLPVRHAQALLEELLEAPAACGRGWRTAGEVLRCAEPPLQYLELYKLTRKLGGVVGFRGLRPHLLRHAFASNMMRKGAPLAVVQRALGHSSQQTTLRYIHADSGDVEKYVDAWSPPQGI
jgi:integrase/recombinase XerD